MNKKVITGLIVLMGISILGIIMVQWIWMNRAISVKNELFDRSVVEAMQYTSLRLEKMRDVAVVTSISMNDSLIGSSWGNRTSKLQSSRITNFITTEKSPGSKNMTMVIQSGDGGTYSWNSTTVCDSILMEENHKIKIESNCGQLDVDSLFGSGIHRIDSMVTAFSDVDIVVPDIKKKVVYKAVRLKNVANQIVTEIISSENSIPKTDEIRKILTEKLVEKNIPIDFRLGILKDSIIVTHGSSTDSILLSTSPYRTTLFPNDILDKNLSFAVYFPEKGKFIYKTIFGLLLISMALSLLVLITFAAGVFFLLKQKKISEMKSDFINNMTHEFKTPIATISVAADSVLNEKVLSEPEKIRYFMGMIKKENTRMNRQVEDILTIARLDKKEFEFKWQLVNIHELIEETIQGIQLQMEAKSGSISTVLNAGNPIVTCDNNHCSNVLYNLLDNAIKYTLAAPEIIIETRNVTNGVIVSVQDNGIGMSKAAQSKIFEKFYRQTSGNIHNVKGFGLGLSYVKAVAEANKGTVSVKSEPGKGSRFEVFVPFVREASS